MSQLDVADKTIAQLRDEVSRLSRELSSIERFALDNVNGEATRRFVLTSIANTANQALRKEVCS